MEPYASLCSALPERVTTLSFPPLEGRLKSLLVSPDRHAFWSTPGPNVNYPGGHLFDTHLHRNGYFYLAKPLLPQVNDLHLNGLLTRRLWVRFPRDPLSESAGDS